MPSSSKVPALGNALAVAERPSDSLKAVDRPLPPLPTAASNSPVTTSTAEEATLKRDETSPEQTPSPTYDDHGDPPSTSQSGLIRQTPSLSNVREAASPLKGKGEKRKRNRVTPEQLVELEGAFTKDRSPTAAFRREMSQRLGMTERAVQVWFQNRRAKAKHQDQRIVSPQGLGNSNPVPLEHLPHSEDGRPLTASQDGELLALIEESEAVTIFPCYELSIGSWRREKAHDGRPDLVTYWAEQSQTLVWFIRTLGSHFKMRIPISQVKSIHVTRRTPGQITVNFELTRKPWFYIKQPYTYAGYPQGYDPNGSMADWAPCRDWTEHNQATTVFQHHLTGSERAMYGALRRLPAKYGLFGASPTGYPQPNLWIDTHRRDGYSGPTTPPNPALHPATLPPAVPPLQPPRVSAIQAEFVAPPPSTPDSGISPWSSYPTFGFAHPDPYSGTGRPRSTSDPSTFPAGFDYTSRQVQSANSANRSFPNASEVSYDTPARQDIGGPVQQRPMTASSISVDSPGPYDGTTQVGTTHLGAYDPAATAIRPRSATFHNSGHRYAEKEAYPSFMASDVVFPAMSQASHQRQQPSFSSQSSAESYVSPMDSGYMSNYGNAFAAPTDSTVPSTTDMSQVVPYPSDPAHEQRGGATQPDWYHAQAHLTYPYGHYDYTTFPSQAAQ